MTHFISLFRTVSYLILLQCLYMLIHFSCFFYLYKKDNYTISHCKFIPSYINDTIDIKNLHIKDFLKIVMYPSFQINDYVVINNFLLCPKDWFNSENVMQVTSKISLNKIKRQLLKNINNLLYSLQKISQKSLPKKIVLYDLVTVFLMYENFIIQLYPWQAITQKIVDSISYICLTKKNSLNGNKNKKLPYVFDIRLYSKDKIMYVPIKKEVYDELF